MYSYVSAQRGGRNIGKPEHFEIALDIGLGAACNLDGGRVEQKVYDGHEHDGEQIAGQRR